MSCGPHLSLTDKYLLYLCHFNNAISRQSYLVRDSARGSQRTALWAPFEKPCLNTLAVGAPMYRT